MEIEQKKTKKAKFLFIEQALILLSISLNIILIIAAVVASRFITESFDYLKISVICALLVVLIVVIIAYTFDLSTIADHINKQKIGHDDNYDPVTKEDFRTSRESLDNIHVRFQQFLNESQQTHAEISTEISNVMDNYYCARKKCGRMKELCKHEYEIINSREYPIKMKTLRENAKSRMYFTNFSENPNNNQQLKTYFADEAHLLLNNSTIVRRIVTIPGNKKLEFCKKMVNTAAQCNCENLHIAYLNLECRKTPPIVGVDIIDDHVFIKDPLFARLRSDMNILEPHNIYINSQDIANEFARYHEKIWEKIVDLNNSSHVCSDQDFGYMLYNGENGINANIDSYWSIIESIINRIES